MDIKKKLISRNNFVTQMTSVTINGDMAHCQKAATFLSCTEVSLPHPKQTLFPRFATHPGTVEDAESGSSPC